MGSSRCERSKSALFVHLRRDSLVPAHASVCWLTLWSVVLCASLKISHDACAASAGIGARPRIAGVPEVRDVRFPERGCIAKTDTPSRGVQG